MKFYREKVSRKAEHAQVPKEEALKAENPQKFSQQKRGEFPEQGFRSLFEKSP